MNRMLKKYKGAHITKCGMAYKATMVRQPTAWIKNVVIGQNSVAKPEINVILIMIFLASCPRSRPSVAKAALNNPSAMPKPIKVHPIYHTRRPFV